MNTTASSSLATPLGTTLGSHYRYLLAKYLKPLWPQATLLAILILANIGLQLVNPQIMRRFIDTIAGEVAVGEGNNELIWIGVLFLSVAVVQQIVGIIVVYISTNIGWRATNRLRFDLAQHCMGLDMSFHNKRTPGEMITRIDNDTGALSRFFSQFLIRMASQSLLLVGMLLLLFREDWRVGVALTLFSAISLFIIWRLKDIAVPYWRDWSRAGAALYGFLEERLNGVEDIRTAGAKGYVLNGFYTLIRALMKISLKVGWLNSILMNTTQVLFAAGTGIAFVVSAWLFLNETITIGAVYIIFHYSAMLTGPIQNLALEAQQLQSAGGSVERIAEFLKTESKLETAYGQKIAASPPTSATLPAIVFKHVSFGYDGDSADAKQKSPNGRVNGHIPTAEKVRVIHDLSFRLGAGKSLGLIGRTGSGKSTLARLLFRLYDPDSGTIYLNHDDITAIPLSTLRQQIGMVTQNIELFNASVRDNLTFFDDTIPDKKIIAALDQLSLSTWFDALPAGLDTELSSGGKELSAGQAQLLAFTRIFLQDPAIIVLDEASSRLDPATEQQIEQAVQRLISGRTAIIIAHRLSTLQHVDEIMIMSAGRIEEYGERDALANDATTRFSQLLNGGLDPENESEEIDALLEVLS